MDESRRENNSNRLNFDIDLTGQAMQGRNRKVNQD